ncbi:MAG: hypothetical protein J0H56_05750 [Micrococcales bacterium]|nr:hypothetical protein [Micrococcales bacterium]
MFAVYLPYAVAYNDVYPNYTDPRAYFGIGLVFATFHGLFYGVAALVGAILFESIVVRFSASLVAEVASTVLGGSVGITGIFLLAPPWIGQPWGPIYMAISGTLGMCAFALLVLAYRGKLRRRRLPEAKAESDGAGQPRM